jgi:hypothetical protein
MVRDYSAGLFGWHLGRAADEELQRIRERLRPRSSGSDRDSRPRRRGRVDPAVSAEARAAGLLEFDARCPEASPEDRGRFIEELKELVGKGGSAAQAVEAAMKMAACEIWD